MMFFMRRWRCSKAPPQKRATAIASAAAAIVGGLISAFFTHGSEDGASRSETWVVVSITVAALLLLGALTWGLLRWRRDQEGR